MTMSWSARMPVPPTGGGGILKPCVCGVDDWEPLPDIYAHFDDWQHFRCLGCQREIAIAVPEGSR